MKRLIYPSFRVYYRFQRWRRRRFTKAGFLVMCLIIAAAVAGIDTNRTMAYQSFTFLVALIVISVVWSIFFRIRLTATRVLPKFGTVGEPLCYRIVVQNPSKTAEKGLFLFENFEDPRPGLKEFLTSSEPGEEKRNIFDRTVGFYRWQWLISRKQAFKVKEQPLPVTLPEIPVEITPSNRGHLNFTGITIARPDPLGLFNSLVTIPAKQSVMVLPKRYILPDLRLPGTRRYQSGGIALTSSVGESEEFISLRDYRPGDSLRRIHWKSWAKIGKPVVKEYQDEFFVRHALVLDTFQEAEFSEVFEEAVSVASSFACTVRTQESLLDLMFVGPEAYCFTSGRGLAHTDKTLRILASVSPCTDKPFSELPPLVFNRADILSGCICIFLSWDEQRKNFIGQLREFGIPLLVLVVTEDNADGKTDFDPGPMKDIPENFHRLETGKIQEGLEGLY
ncbi:MAG: DUF58 domain-containing protein [Desulfobacteraceae bacterium]|nr:DUF58 domain-containing protein [Desulfobacteraceae bacterium]